MDSTDGSRDGGMTTPTQDAWGLIADAFAEALWTLGLDVEAERTMLSCYGHVAVMAGRVDRREQQHRDSDVGWLHRGTDRPREYDERRALANAPGGLQQLWPFIPEGTQRNTLWRALFFRNELATIEQTRQALASGIRLDDIGPKRAQLLRDAIDAYDRREA